MKILYFALAMSMASVVNVFGAEPNNFSVQEVIGQGKNRDDAIKNGLYNAVSQARGVKVGSGSYEFGFLGAGADINNTKGGKKIGFGAVSIETSGTAYTTEIGGLIKSYKILEERSSITATAN